MPSEHIIKNNENSRKSNNAIYPILLSFSKEYIKGISIIKTLKIKDECLLTEKIYGDGNCYYRSLSYYFTKTEEYHPFFRDIIYKYLKMNYEQIVIDTPYIYYDGKCID